MTLVKREHLPMLNAAKTALPSAEKSKKNQLAARTKQTPSPQKKGQTAKLKPKPQQKQKQVKAEKSTNPANPDLAKKELPKKEPQKKASSKTGPRVIASKKSLIENNQPAKMRPQTPKQIKTPKKTKQPDKPDKRLPKKVVKSEPSAQPAKASRARARISNKNIASLDKKDASLNQAEKAQVFNYYLALVADQIAKYWRPPRMRLSNVRGFVKFEFDRNGKLLMARIDRDSGDLLLDLSVVEAIKRVPGFPMPESESVWQKYYQGKALILEYTPAMLLHNKRRVMLQERAFRLQ